VEGREKKKNPLAPKTFDNSNRRKRRRGERERGASYIKPYSTALTHVMPDRSGEYEKGRGEEGKLLTSCDTSLFY